MGKPKLFAKIHTLDDISEDNVRVSPTPRENFPAGDGSIIGRDSDEPAATGMRRIGEGPNWLFVPIGRNASTPGTNTNGGPESSPTDSTNSGNEGTPPSSPVSSRTDSTNSGNEGTPPSSPVSSPTPESNNSSEPKQIQSKGRGRTGEPEVGHTLSRKKSSSLKSKKSRRKGSRKSRRSRRSRRGSKRRSRRTAKKRHRRRRSSSHKRRS